MPHQLWFGTSVYNGHFRGPVTHTYCRAFSSGAFITCFYDLSLWNSHLLPSFKQWSCHYLFLRLGSVAAEFGKPTFRLWGQHSNPPPRSNLYEGSSEDYISFCKLQCVMKTTMNRSLYKNYTCFCTAEICRWRDVTNKQTTYKY